MRNYHLYHPFNDSRAALPWPTDPPGDRTRARRPYTQPRKSDHANPGGAPATAPWPAGYAPLPRTPNPPSPTTSSPAKASAEGKRRTYPQPPTSQNRRQGNNLPTPPNTPAPQPSQPTRRPPRRTPPPYQDQASSSSSLQIQEPPQAETYSEFQTGAKVQQPFCNDHTGDWIWCEGTIQYPLQELGPNRG